MVDLAEKYNLRTGANDRHMKVDDIEGIKLLFFIKILKRSKNCQTNFTNKKPIRIRQILSHRRYPRSQTCEIIFELNLTLNTK